jgi:hypothetical protein
MKNSKMNEEAKYGSKQKSPLGGDIEGPEVGGALNRKEFINAAGRYGILALLALLATFLITNRKTTVEEVCTSDYRCGGCSKRDNCTASPTPPKEGLK